MYSVAPAVRPAAVSISSVFFLDLAITSRRLLADEPLGHVAEMMFW
jgi:hypothetical protein